jgi:hypothetical protein
VAEVVFEHQVDERPDVVGMLAAQARAGGAQLLELQIRHELQRLAHLVGEQSVDPGQRLGVSLGIVRAHVGQGLELDQQLAAVLSDRVESSGRRATGERSLGGA